MKVRCKDLVSFINSEYSDLGTFLNYPENMLMCGLNSVSDFGSGHSQRQSQDPDSNGRVNFRKTFIKDLGRL